MSGGFEFGAQVAASLESLPRYIGLGGTSELWAGKWRRLDPIDFGRLRDGRGWPLAYVDLVPYYDRVAADYGWPVWFEDASFGQYGQLAAAYGLKLVEIYEEDPPLRLRSRWNELRDHLSVEILCRAQLIDAAFDSHERCIRRIRVTDGTGARWIDAPQFVVACGGIESVHVSHQLRALSRAESAMPSSAPLPAKYPGFVDHPKGFVGELRPGRHASFIDYLHRGQTRLKRLLGFSLPEEELASQGLGNHTVFLWQNETAAGPLRMVINLEQFPEEQNYVSVCAKPSVSWHVSHRTWTDCQTFLDLISARLEAFIGPVTIDETMRFRGASHHCGAIPMGLPGQSVVNKDCRFHDVANLYCASSAVFPIAGSANPTMTIVALSNRLSSHLQTRDGR